MKLDLAHTTLGVTCCLALLGLAPVTQARECKMSNVAGQYGYTSSGTIVTPAVGPFLAVGRVTVTSTGTFSGTQTTSIAGNLFLDEIVQGTYTVNPDCTGTLDAFIYHGSALARTARLNIVWDNLAREFRAIFLTTGTAVTITGRKMFRDDDDE